MWVAISFAPAENDVSSSTFKIANYPLRLMTGPGSGARLGIARDPSGNTIEVLERPGTAGRAVSAR